MKTSVSLAVLSLSFLVLAGVVYAQEIPVDTWYCGIKLTVPGTYNMTNDISCSSGVIAIEVLVPNVTLNLQGHAIVGPYKDQYYMYGIVARQSAVAIKGPGKINGFSFGAALLGSDTISHVHFEQNRLAIKVEGDRSTISYCTVLQVKGVGIQVFNRKGTSIIGNIVTGADFALSADGDGTSAKGNAFVGNMYGMYVAGTFAVVTGNDISYNSQFGAEMKGSGTITGNHFNGNTTYGLWALTGGFVIQNNTADNNKQYGIYLTAISGTTLTSNTAIANGVLDLSWDGYGTGNTWMNNNCDMWSVNMGDKPCVFP